MHKYLVKCITIYFSIISIFLYIFNNNKLHYINLSKRYLQYINNSKKYISEIIKYKKEIKYYPPYNEENLLLPKYFDYPIKRNIINKRRNSIKIVIATLSSPHNYRKRYSFRLRYNKINILDKSLLIFFIGQSKYQNNKILETESLLFNDIVQFSFQNSYLNLTLLSIMAIKYCSRHFNKLDYYIKTDDDMLLNYNLLNKTIQIISPSYNIIYGHVGRVIKANRNTKSSNFIPHLQYSYEYLPKYVYGGLIIIPKISLKLINNLTFYNQSYIWREDVNLGLLCKLCKCNVSRFPNNVDIKINQNRCTLSNRVIASEIKSMYDRFYCYI